MLKNFKGITLIGLVVTIVILLILSGIAIVTLAGNNGLITQANRAKEETEKATDRELITLAVSEAQIGKNGYQELNSNNLQEAIDNQFNARNIVVSNNGNETFTVSCLDTLKDYIITKNGIEDGIDWNEKVKNAVAPESQDELRNEGTIGIGTDGKPVDMDLWEYNLLEDGTYCLNDENSLNLQEPITSGYIGDIIDGKIIGQIPQYISTDNGEHYMPVTSLLYSFRDVTQLKEMPVIPQTVTSMRDTFNGCTNLELIGYIPNSVVNMQGTFHSCVKLNNISNLPSKLENMNSTFQSTGIIRCPYIPDTVESMPACFYDCSYLLSIENIPKNMTDLTLTFYRCKSLEDINIIIPDKVTNLRNTFNGCTKLSGNIEILADPVEYKNCFLEASINVASPLKLSGDINVLQILLETKSENSNIIY